tara:strand:- start:864 stop:1769 length:906 start_codon:yes stop_codon:yes gene_type:complete
MDISIVIVSYNVKEYIISCIDSIYKHSKSNYSFEIVIVDNNSKDDTLDSLNKNFPKISLIKNKYNAGFSFAVNQGVKKCKGKYILILNPDTLFVEDLLEKLIDKAKNQKALGAMGPAIVNDEGTVQQSYWRYPSVFNTLLSIFHLDLLNYKKNYKDKKFDKFSNVESISGAAFLIPRVLFNKLNGFNENLFWMEDIDLCYRLNQMNYKTYYLHSTKLVHFSGKSAATNYKVAISNQLLSKIKFFKIHHSRHSSLLILVSVLFISVVKSIIMLFIAPFSKIYRKKVAAYLFTIRSIINNFIT